MEAVVETTHGGLLIDYTQQKKRDNQLKMVQVADEC